MTVSKRFLTITSFVLLTIFLICILTVESHENARGPLNSRCPSCVDNNIHFAVDAQSGLTLGLHHTIEYIRPPELARGFSSSIVSLNKYRAPPA
jgi:hypothetical protein